MLSVFSDYPQLFPPLPDPSLSLSMQTLKCFNTHSNSNSELVEQSFKTDFVVFLKHISV